MILLPIGMSFGVIGIVSVFLTAPLGLAATVAWWAILLAVGLGTASAIKRVARRLLPLIMLLKLSMLFPDRAPSRFAVARQAGSVRRLRAHLAEIAHDPEAAAETANAATILALATALQSHDRKTRGHAERVRVYADLLAEELELPKEDRYRLRWAALLHDIGKLTVTSRILNKPGALNEREWEIVRGHPLEGARIAKPLLEWLGPWAGAIAQHHERFGGGGYPAGLEGEQISLAGRIVAVADAYDTMTAVRSYKKPIAVREAREELARCAPAQFEPDMVRAFLSISLPRLMWRTGPLSFLVTVPYLTALQAAGQQGLAAARAAATAAAVAGVTAAAAATGSAHASAAAARGHAHGLAPRPAAVSTQPRPVGPSPAAMFTSFAESSTNGSSLRPNQADHHRGSLDVRPSEKPPKSILRSRSKSAGGREATLGAPTRSTSANRSVAPPEAGDRAPLGS